MKPVLKITASAVVALFMGRLLQKSVRRQRPGSNEPALGLFKIIDPVIDYLAGKIVRLVSRKPKVEIVDIPGMDDELRMLLTDSLYRDYEGEEEHLGYSRYDYQNCWAQIFDDGDDDDYYYDEDFSDSEDDGVIIFELNSSYEEFYFINYFDRGEGCPNSSVRTLN